MLATIIVALIAAIAAQHATAIGAQSGGQAVVSGTVAPTIGLIIGPGGEVTGPASTGPYVVRKQSENGRETITLVPR